ncbi:hypothetical protein Tco_1413713 [Tanacetum coccineum]
MLITTNHCDLRLTTLAFFTSTSRVSSLRYSKIRGIQVSPSSSTTVIISTSLMDFSFNSSTNTCLLKCAKLVEAILLSASAFLFSPLGTFLIENALKLFLMYNSRKCMYLLHMDLFGPVSPMSVNHEKYTLVIVDEYSRFINTSVDEIGIDDSFRYPPDEFLQDDDPSRKYQSNYGISFYIIPHGHSLTELTQEKHSTEGTQDQVVQIEQINHQSTEKSSENNTETSVHITKSLVPETLESQHASTSSYPVARDRWSQNQHIKLMNIIGDPGEGMLIRSMATKLTAASANKCLFADFLSKIEPKKVSEALKHLGWVNAMQEELNQFYINKVWTLCRSKVLDLF